MRTNPTVQVLTLLTGLAAAASAHAVPGDDASWEVLQSGKVTVECTDISGEPWCRSVSKVTAPIDAVASALEDMSGQAEVFEAVTSIRVLEPDTLHITLDFPGMLSDRDYVAKYSRADDGDARLYRWVPVTHPEAPPVDGIVRLVKMAGEWRLEPVGAETKVTYTWQAELGGSFPSWATGIARKKTGNEALKDLANAQSADLTEP